MPVRLSGATSGYVELSAPAVAGSTSLELPTDSIKPGLVLITTQSISSASTASFNNVFTSTYENYRLILWISTSTGTDIRLRLRSGGTDNSASSYHFGGIRVTTNATVNGVGGGSTSYWTVISATGTNIAAACTIDILQPQAANFTTYNGGGSGYAGGVAQYSGEATGGQFAATTQFDGMTIYPASGTMSGVARVYGYRNSL